MSRTPLSALFAICLLLVVATGVGAADPKLPLIGGKPALAVINGEPLTLEEYNRALASLHEGRTDNAVKSKSDPSQLLERLINAKLIVQEARNIGLDSLPEVISAVNVFEEESLRGMLYGSHVRNIKKPDKKEVDRRYEEVVKEVKVISVMFEREESGARMEADVNAGVDFRDAARRALDSGEAKGSLEGQYIRYESLSPEVSRVVSAMKEGEVSPLMRTGNRFSMLKLEDIRIPIDPASREKAEKDALEAKRLAAIKAYLEALKKKYVKVDAKLVDSLDYESPEPGFETLLEDKRIVAEVKAEKPVTVAELTKALLDRFYHGAERAARGKKINKMKHQVLDDILNKRVALKEAKSKKLDRTEYHKDRVEEYRNGVLFAAFLQKVIDPEIKVEDAEIRSYFEAHIGEYTTPEMVRVDSLAFSNREDAEDAVEKLRKGADFQWMRTNAAGQVDATKAGNLLHFGDVPLLTSSLPEAVQKAISGATAGDYRLFADAEGRHYVLYLQDIVPATPEAYEAVEGQIRKKLYFEKRNKALREWEKNLREASDVTIFAKDGKSGGTVKPKER